MYVYLLLIIAIPALIVFAFMFGTVIQAVQEGMNPSLGVETWVDSEHFNVFYTAASVVTNFWTYILGIILLGLAYWVWIYTQRKGVNGY